MLLDSSQGGKAGTPSAGAPVSMIAPGGGAPDSMTSQRAGATHSMAYCLSMPRQAAVTAVLVGCRAKTPKLAAEPFPAAAVNAAGRQVLSEAGFAKP
jgi:mitochondrial fission protein ELM1